MQLTTSLIREKVLSKWIKSYFEKDPEYIKLKKGCAEVAGNLICKIIKESFTLSNIFTFFRIYPKEYYYAKTTNHETTILKVPAKGDFTSSIEFLECKYEVPKSQLNIISTFRNKKTGKTIQFRNECRFSHGQFNGTPEAKMYIVRNTPLTELYDPL